MLKTLESVFRAQGIDYFIVGALARDIQLSARGGAEAKRKTNDVDIALVLDAEEQFYQIRQALIATGEFEETPKYDIKLLYRGSIDVDMLPFGAIENEHRELHLTRHPVLTMDMHGFREVYPFVEEHIIAEGLSLKVCSLEGLVLLKLIANASNSSRSKDITDIEHIIEVYFWLNAEVFYTNYNNAMDLYDTALPDYLPLVSARVIGRRISELLINTTGGKEKLQAILSRRPTATWQAMLDGLND